MTYYTIGIDFGTLSARAVLMDVHTGEECATYTWPYAHGVMEESLPDGTPLGTGWALQDPQDYLDALDNVIPGVIGDPDALKGEVVGIGIDFTSCTLLPVRADGHPLCFEKMYRSVPHAYVKLWKHHAAQDQTQRINKLIEERQESWISYYGGKISSEWQLPKVLQILEEAPYIYDEAAYFVEAGDWIVWYLTGKLCKSTCAAGYKGLYIGDKGYPEDKFFQLLNPKLSDYVRVKMNYPMVHLGKCVGKLKKSLAISWKMSTQPAVAAACIDAHAMLPAVEVTGPGTMVSVLGTSACHILIAREKRNIPGISGVVKDGIYPGYYAYEAGQSCFGEHFSWMLKNMIPEQETALAKQQKIGLHQLLQQKAASLFPGESGLIMLDWWNGNRSILSNDNLSGLILGFTLQTRPEELYLTFLEAVTFGARVIMNAYQSGGIEIQEVVAAGGISWKNDLLMQIYADIMQVPVFVAASTECAAAGSAIFAATAAGQYASVNEAAKILGKRGKKVYRAEPERAAVYNQIFKEYSQLYNYFGQGENKVMERLKKIQRDSRRKCGAL